MAGEISARVLIVDDDDRSRAVASALLRGTSNALEFAASGAAAIELARTWNPDLVLLDVMMPEIDGFEVCRRLRADPRTADLRVFMLTALDDAASRLTAFEAGADDFISKPLNRVETLARIQGIARLNRYRELARRRRELGAAPGADSNPGPLEVERTLAEALESLTLWYQPIVTCGAGATEILGYEALIRTASAVLGHPEALLSAAAALGRLPSVSRAVRHCLAARAAAHPDATFFFNLAPEELGDETLYSGGDVLLPHAARLVVEITEQGALGAADEMRRRLVDLRRRGFRIAVDDLGKGYSSLESLVLVEPEFVKLDAGFVKGLADDPRRRAIVQSIVTLAHDLGIELIGEGVETERDRATLEQLGCRHMQGYLFGRAAPEPLAPVRR